MATEERIDGRVERGRRTREGVLNAAVALASVSGLAGLSLADLATELGVSKSGLFAHWPTKEDLQLAVVDRAAQQWADEVIGPALTAPAGVRRLIALHDGRLKFYRRAVLPGRCFFFSVQAEFDDRPGRVHDRLVAVHQRWLGFIASIVKDAVNLGELSSGTDPRQTAFVVEALGDSVVTAARLLSSRAVFGFARRALLDHLRALGGDPDLLATL